MYNVTYVIKFNYQYLFSSCLRMMKFNKKFMPFSQFKQLCTSTIKSTVSPELCIRNITTDLSYLEN